MEIICSLFPWVCSSAGRAAVSKAAGRGFESLRTRSTMIIKDARGETW